LDDGFLAARASIVGALMDNPVVAVTDADVLARLADPARDCTFEELELDSLSRMELIVHLQDEFGIELDDLEMDEYSSVNALARFLGSRPA